MIAAIAKEMEHGACCNRSLLRLTSIEQQSKSESPEQPRRSVARLKKNDYHKRAMRNCRSGTRYKKKTL
jgi:hypothetical protein